ncbi:MAG TPA: MBL fold metallo-hydrolase [Methanomicrobiales archaeon]|nr:MBL fold metallo-hydrolase [Methanomicrobiales archaeon]
MEIVPGIHQVDGVNGNSYIHLNGGFTLIDTGLPHSSKKILGYIQKTLDRNPADIETIVLTHYHIDHIGSLDEIKRVSNARVAIHEADADYVSGKKTQPVPPGMRGALYRGLSTVMKARAVEADILLHDGDTIAGLACIHTPGHTPGSIALLDQTKKVLFSGDLIRFDGEKITGPSPKFTPDPEKAYDSIRKIARLDYDILLPGHGVPLRPDAAERVRAFSESLG